jgi:methenyltetrahydrofolate cyclohydrolase
VRWAAGTSPSQAQTLVRAKPLSVETLESYLGQLASTQPTPGGGSAATIVAALAAALVAMVTRISASNPKYEAHRETALRIASDADVLREGLRALQKRDERAFEAVIAAQALPRADNERQARMETALRQAAEVPLATCDVSTRILRLAAEALAIPNRHLVSDIGCSAEFGYAAIAACAYNVRVNHRYMREAVTILHQSTRLAAYETEAATLLANVRSGVEQMLA